jgi:hypothetical protein
MTAWILPFIGFTFFSRSSAVTALAVRITEDQFLMGLVCPKFSKNTGTENIEKHKGRFPSWQVEKNETGGVLRLS